MQGDGKAAALAPTGAEKVAREVLASGLGAAITDTLFNPLDIIKVPPRAMQASKRGSSCAMQAWHLSSPSGSHSPSLRARDPSREAPPSW